MLVLLALSGLRNRWSGICLRTCVSVASLSIVLGARADSWVYDWSKRVDRDGTPAGIYTNTPFPITEISTTYSIKTDEFPSGKTYNLGTLYFVDGARPDDSGDGRTLATAKKTIAAAITTAGSGNKAVIVRGAHDSFDGVYRVTVSFNRISGIGDTNRFMLTGYAQERPVIDAGYTTSMIIRRGDPSPAYVTVQRLKLQNTQASGVRLGWDAVTDKRDTYFNCVDIWFYGCGNNDNNPTDGNCYYLNTDYGFISHCLFERSVGHGVKIGDGSSYCILEWCISRENGWWPGKTNFINSRTVALDLPSDRDTQTNCTVRYCIASGCVSHGLELRRVHNFTIHHNEIYGFGHGPSMAGNMNGVVPHGVTIIATSWGHFEDNIVHSPDFGNTNGSLLQIGTSLTNSEVYICNNLLYNAAANGQSLYLDIYQAAHTFIYNNTIVQSNGTYVVATRTGQAWTNEFVNNIVWQQGTGSCAEMIYHSVAPIHHHNLLYYPSGTGPEWGTSGDSVASPQLFANPTGAFSESFLDLRADSRAVNAGTNMLGVPASDIHGRSRAPQVDIGAAQYRLAPAKNLHRPDAAR